MEVFRLIFCRCFISVGPPSPTRKISHRLKFLPVKTRPNCLGRYRKPPIEGQEKQLQWWTAMLLTNLLWRPSLHETTSHHCFPSAACLYPQSSLMMPARGLLQRERARENTYKLRKLPELELKQSLTEDEPFT